MLAISKLWGLRIVLVKLLVVHVPLFLEVASFSNQAIKASLSAFRSELAKYLYVCVFTFRDFRL